MTALITNQHIVNLLNYFMEQEGYTPEDMSSLGWAIVEGPMVVGTTQGPVLFIPANLCDTFEDLDKALEEWATEKGISFG